MLEEGFELSVTKERNLAMELVRVTEAGALNAARWMGKGNKEMADQAAVDAIRQGLDGVDMSGVVIGVPVPAHDVAVVDDVASLTVVSGDDAHAVQVL